MIRNCKNCGGRIVFDIKSQALKCGSCESTFAPREYTNENEPLTMECDIYRCNSCGAEISINDNELATFCAFCGNSNVVFNRVQTVNRPSKVIPFTVTKEEAVSEIRKKFSKGFFIPKSIKNFDIDIIRGIYIPYYVSRVEYDGSMIITSSVKTAINRSEVLAHRRTAFGTLPWVTTDSSSILSDSVSQRMEPFDFMEAKTFDEDYLLGFYSDIPDVKPSVAKETAANRVITGVEEEYKNTVYGDSKKIVKRRDIAKVYTEPYIAMLPAWFLTFRYNNKPYTIVVNGQSGKVIGGVPFSKGKFIPLAIVASLLVSALLSAVGLFTMFNIVEETGFEGILTIPVAVLYVLCICRFKPLIKHIKDYRKSLLRTTSENLEDFTRNRESEK